MTPLLMVGQICGAALSKPAVIVYHPDFALRLSQFGIDVPLLDQRVELTAKYHDPGVVDLNELPKLSQKDLLRVHERNYIDSLFDERLLEQLKRCYERPELKLSQEQAAALRETLLRQASGSAYSFELALKHSWCFFLGGGMHHARSDQPGGYCLINDIAIGVKRLMARGKIQRAWIIDIDAHKGDGTAEVFLGESAVATLSIHMAYGWPFGSEGYVDVDSTLDIPILPLEQDQYHQRLEAGLRQLERDFGGVDLAVVVAGADPYEFDELESSSYLKLSLEQMRLRDEIVAQFLQSRNIPQAWLMAGGYGQRSHEVYIQSIGTLQKLQLSHGGARGDEV